MRYALRLAYSSQTTKVMRAESLSTARMTTACDALVFVRATLRAKKRTMHAAVSSRALNRANSQVKGIRMNAISAKDGFFLLLLLQVHLLLHKLIRRYLPNKMVLLLLLLLLSEELDMRIR